jgi:hypothetical protein
MANLLDKKLSFALAVCLAVYWGVAAMAPFLMTDRAVKTDAWIWGVVAVFAGYFVYTGYCASKQGWKSRFVLRIVIPAALFVSAWIVVGVATWLDRRA